MKPKIEELNETEAAVKSANKLSLLPPTSEYRSRKSSPKIEASDLTRDHSVNLMIDTEKKLTKIEADSNVKIINQFESFGGQDIPEVASHESAAEDGTSKKVLKKRTTMTRFPKIVKSSRDTWNRLHQRSISQP